MDSTSATGEIGPHRKEELLTVGEMARRTGVSASALHFYERQGLLTSSRTVGNQRRYARYQTRRVALISVAKRLGMPLSDVASAFEELPHDRAPSHEDWQRASRRWRVLLEDRRRGIEQLERELTSCIGCGCLSMKACSLLNPGDVLAGEGSGPRRLLLGRDD